MRVPKGYSQIVQLAGPKDLAAADAIPDGANYAVIIAEGADVRWRDDGTNPTASVGMPLPNGGVLEYDGKLSALKFIQVSAGAKINVSYYQLA